jgi:hypothetical protein
MHTPWLLVAHHIEYFDTQENIDKFLFKRKRRLKKKRKRNRNRKKKKENPPSAGLDSAQPPPLSYALISPPEAQHAPPPAPALAPRRCQTGPTRQPHLPFPPRVCPLSQAGPACQPLLPLAHDQAIDAFAASHRLSHRLAINALTSSVWHHAPPRTVLEPSLHPRLPEPSRRHYAPSSPPWQAHRCSPPLLPPPSPTAYKRTAPSPLFHHTRP